MDDDRLKFQDHEEKFTCLICAMIYKTKIYSNREPFRKMQDKIWARCPRCNNISYKTIDKIINDGENNNE